jgi:Domain of unknown function (DUF5658)
LRSSSAPARGVVEDRVILVQAPAARVSIRETWFGNFVIILFLVSQLLDGAFTYLGLSAFGLSEGNPLIALTLRHAGVGPGLTVAKLLAVAFSILLHLLGLHRTLAVLTLLYLSLAVLPWTYVLFFAR